MSQPTDADATLTERFQGEVLGEALFAQLAELEDDLARVPQWRLLERLERFVGGRLQDALVARGLPAEPAAEQVEAGRKAAAALAALSDADRMHAIGASIENAVASLHETKAPVPEELADVGQLFTGHEEALQGFFRREAAGEGGDAVIEAFLANHGAPEEPPIPEGMALMPMDPAFREDPFPVMRLLRERAPVHRDRGFASRVVLTRHDDVMKIVRDLTFLSDPRKSLPDDPVRMFLDPEHPDADPSMLFLDDPEHRRLRNFVSRAFTPRAVERWRPMIREVANELLAEVAVKVEAKVEAEVEEGREGEFDLMDALAAPLPAIAIARVLGVDTADQALFKEWSVASSEAFFNPFGDAEMREAGRAAGESLRQYFAREIERRRAAPRDDLISKMVEAEREGDRLTGEEIVSQCNLLLIAGNVTTTDLIGNGVRALLEHPDQLARLQARPELIGNAVEEMLRFDPPVQTTGRIAPHDFDIDGVPVRAGESITLLLAAANRDPAVYPDPDRFDIERADPHHQSFGGGTHLCLGAHLARVEAQEAIGALVARFPKLRASGGGTWKQVPGFRGMADYRVRCD